MADNNVFILFEEIVAALNGIKSKVKSAIEEWVIGQLQTKGQYGGYDTSLKIVSCILIQENMKGKNKSGANTHKSY